MRIEGKISMAEVRARVPMLSNKMYKTDNFIGTYDMKYMLGSRVNG